MSGLEIRAQIDAELVKGLLIINGGGSVALLTFLPVILGEPEYVPLSKAVLWGLLSFQVGLVAAVIHNRLRRVCSLEFEKHNYNPPPCNRFPVSLFKFASDAPCVCRASVMCMWASIVAFILAGTIVIAGGFCVLSKQEESNLSEKAETAPNTTLQSTLKSGATEFGRYALI